MNMAQIIIDLPPNQALRVAVAFGRYFGLADENGAPRNATSDEIKQFIVRQIRGVVIQQERRVEEAKIIIPSIDMT